MNKDIFTPTRRIIGPNTIETVYELEFNERNLKALFEKRITVEDAKLLSQKRIGEVSFSVKDERTGTVRDVRDVTGILHKSMDLFLKPFDYLANGDYISAQQKAEMRQMAIDQGLLPPIQVQGTGTEVNAKPPTGTYS